MAILITRVDHADRHVLKVDGRLSAEDTDLLLQMCAAMPPRLVLDLTDLRFADRRGVGALRELQARGVIMVGLSPYLDLLLSRPAPAGGA
jgi:anti-anti-sigma regulatory factor